MPRKTKEVAFPTQYSESVQKGTFEVFTKPSMTEPDNAMSIPEIIARFTRGYGVEVTQRPWSVGSASEEGEELRDNENFFEDFVDKQQEPAVSPAEQKEESKDPENPSEGEDPRA